VLVAGALCEHYAIKPNLAEPGLARNLALIAAYLPVAIVLLIDFRNWSLCPDWLAAGTSTRASVEGAARLYDTVPVMSIDEEYRFIEFHPFPCGCRESPERNIGSHGVTLSPLWLLAVPWAAYTLPVFRLTDMVEVTCPGCGGQHTYSFDIGRMPHIREGFNRLFRHDPKVLLGNHIRMVRNLRQQSVGREFHGLRF
jgi:hypothetical protein